jgi:hypothetical protein
MSLAEYRRLWGANMQVGPACRTDLQYDMVQGIQR